MAIENLSATTLRNIIGDLELDQCLTSRDVINTKMRAILDEATDPWGIKVHRVELKNILPPKDIQNAMEKQMKAERERREAILQGRGREESPPSSPPRGENQSRDTPRRGQEAGADTRGSRAGRRPSWPCSSATADSIKLLNEAAPSDPGHTHPRARGLRRRGRRQGDEDNHTRARSRVWPVCRGHSRERQRAEGRVQLRSEPI